MIPNSFSWFQKGGNEARGEVRSLSRPARKQVKRRMATVYIYRNFPPLVSGTIAMKPKPTKRN